MPFQKFSAYNIGGAILWSSLFVSAGALLGNIPAVKHNFSIVSKCPQLSRNVYSSISICVLRNDAVSLLLPMQEHVLKALNR